ncbi:hypothetical protein L6252_01120 [Candidatus Parcubacteria bacterium]|nr:hypothetical protein [Candidatus Parcubacteria bacterium]
MQKKYKALIVIGAILAVLTGIWFIIPSNPQRELDNEEEASTPVPKLFAENDYIIDEQPDATYILIPKLNFKAKVPTNWNVSKQKVNNIEKEEYWIDMYSPDATDLTQKSFLEQGCGISVSAGDEKENILYIENQIADIKNNTDENLQSNYQYEIINVGPYEGVKWLSTEKPFLGQFTGIDIPINNAQLISLNAVFPPNYKEQCEPLWQEFIESITFN